MSALNCKCGAWTGSDERGYMVACTTCGSVTPLAKGYIVSLAQHFGPGWVKGYMSVVYSYASRCPKTKGLSSVS